MRYGGPMWAASALSIAWPGIGAREWLIVALRCFERLRAILDWHHSRSNRSAVAQRSEGLHSSALDSRHTDVIDAALVPRSTPDRKERANSAFAASASWLMPSSTRLILTAFPNATAMSNAHPLILLRIGKSVSSCLRTENAL